MSDYKLKIKIGSHEFEAEGPIESVERQFAEFRDLILKVAPSGRVNNDAPKRPISLGEGTGRLGAGGGWADPELEGERFLRLFVRDKNNLSLALLPQGDRREADATMLLLLGNRTFFQKDAVSAVALSTALRQSGYSVDRLDRQLNPFIGGDEALLLRSGLRRGVHYRLTNLGLARAEKVAEDLLNSVP